MHKLKSPHKNRLKERKIINNTDELVTTFIAQLLFQKIYKLVAALYDPNLSRFITVNGNYIQTIK